VVSYLFIEEGSGLEKGRMFLMVQVVRLSLIEVVSGLEKGRLVLL
jgi:hypothetical protein